VSNIKTIVLATTAMFALAGCGAHTWAPPASVAYAPAAYEQQSAVCVAQPPSQTETELALAAANGSSAMANTLMNQYWFERQMRGC
jgi:hypothetical protein